MTESNVSNSTSGTEPSSAFQSAHSALARKPLPGPQWAWPALAAVAIAGVAYLVAGTSGEHVAHHAAPSVSAEGAPPEAAEPTTATAALQPQAPAAAPASPPAAPASGNDVAGSTAKAEAEPAKAEAEPAKAEAEPAKASDDTGQAVASASSATKKKKARRAKRRKAERSEP